MKIVFLGSPEIAVLSLKSLCLEKNIDVIAVVTQNDKPKSRGKKVLPTSIKLCAQSLNIPVFETQKIRADVELIEKLKSIEPDFFVTFAFGQMLSKEVLDIPKIATVNLHASLLPKYRGANPIARAIIEGEIKTGVTTMITELSMDTGPICLCQEIEIKPEMNMRELSEEISNVAPELLVKTLNGLYNKTLVPYKQGDVGVTYAPKFEKSDLRIGWVNKSCEICNKIRALNAYFLHNGKIIKVTKAKDLGLNSESEPGLISFIGKNGLEVSGVLGKILIEKVKPEGKNEMDAYAWALGARIKEGDKFEC